MFWLHVPDSMFLIPCSWLNIPDSMSLVQCSWFHVLGSIFLVPCSWFNVPGSMFLSMFLVPCSWFHVPGSMFLIPSFSKVTRFFQHLVSGYRFYLLSAFVPGSFVVVKVGSYWHIVPGSQNINIETGSWFLGQKYQNCLQYPGHKH